MNKNQTLNILVVLVELAALVRAAIATFNVVSAVTTDTIYSIFTVLVIEGLFITSLYTLRRESTAPISALLALAFSGFMQYFELRVLDHTITTSEREMLRYVIAFAPIIILALSYIKRMFAEGLGEVLSRFTKDEGETSPLVEKAKKKIP